MIAVAAARDSGERKAEKETSREAIEVQTRVHCTSTNMPGREDGKIACVPVEIGE